MASATASPSALVDCPDHEPDGAGAIGENMLSYGNPVGTHDTRGWPTLKDWPHHASLTHEQTYYSGSSAPGAPGCG